MSIEIEQKYRVDSHDLVASRLESLGAEAGPRVEQEDVYLRHPGRDFARTHEAIRVRRTGSRNAITYKGPKAAGPTKTREEIEVDFADGGRTGEDLLLLFRRLGFDPVMAIRKARTPYRLTFQSRSLEVALDEAEGLGSFVEVETVAEADDVPGAQAAVLELAQVLGLHEVEARSYLRMALERTADSGSP